MCTELKRAGRKKEISILPPGLDTALSVPAWLLLLDAGGHGGLADHLVRLGRSLERGQGADPVKDSTTTPHRSDRKTLRREQEKKIALGHKEDDYEEEQTWQQTMG